MTNDFQDTWPTTPGDFDSTTQLRIFSDEEMERIDQMLTRERKTVKSVIVAIVLAMIVAAIFTGAR